MDKRILICLLVIVVIIGVVLVLTHSKEPEKHVHFKEPPLEPLPSIGPMELELAQESTTEPSETKPEASTTKDTSKTAGTTGTTEQSETSGETFQMPHFNVCGGTINRSKNEQEISKMQPRFQSFGVSRGMAVGESELEAVSFDDNQKGAFRRLGSSGPEKVQPRFTLAMKLMDKGELEKVLSASNPQSTTASTTVLNKIEDAKESMKPKKRSKAK